MEMRGRSSSGQDDTASPFLSNALQVVVDSSVPHHVVRATSGEKSASLLALVKDGLRHTQEQRGNRANVRNIAGLGHGRGQEHPVDRHRRLSQSLANFIEASGGETEGW